MPKYRVDVQEESGWRTLYGDVETTTEAGACEYIRQVLPHRVNGRPLRAHQVKAEPVRVPARRSSTSAAV